MVVHGEICGSGCAERIPAHWCVRFGSSFGGKAEAIEGKKRETIWAGWRSLAGTGNGGRRRGNSRVVGKWEVRRDGATSLCIFVG